MYKAISVNIFLIQGEELVQGGTDVVANFKVVNGNSGTVLDGAFVQFTFDTEYSGRTDTSGTVSFDLRC